MALREPASMDECVYFTQRSIGEGYAKAWVFRGACPQCKKGIMGKPRDLKTGKVKMRAEVYACPSCGYSVEKKAYEESLTANVAYTCPQCTHQGEAQAPFKRKKVSVFDAELQKNIMAEALRVSCGKCGKPIDVTKKMK